MEWKVQYSLYLWNNEFWTSSKHIYLTQSYSWSNRKHLTVLCGCTTPQGHFMMALFVQRISNIESIYIKISVSIGSGRSTCFLYLIHHVYLMSIFRNKIIQYYNTIRPFGFYFIPISIYRNTQKSKSIVIHIFTNNCGNKEKY